MTDLNCSGQVYNVLFLCARNSVRSARLLRLA
jgi:hypothetical protein